MYKLLSVTILLFSLFSYNSLEQPKPKKKKTSLIIVPDSITAYKLADIILTKHYGDIKDQKPYKIRLEADSIWIIDGQMFGAPHPGSCAHLKL